MCIARSGRKRSAVVASIAICLAISAGLSIRSGSAPLPARLLSESSSLSWFHELSDESPEDLEDLTGRALAEALGLRELDPIPEGQLTSDKQGCRSGIAEVPEGGVFCMDAVLDPSAPGYEAKLYVLGRALTGHEVTDDLAAQVETFFAATKADEGAQAAS